LRSWLTRAKEAFYLSDASEHLALLYLLSIWSVALFMDDRMDAVKAVDGLN
jgi:hypothetical protein